MRLLAALLVVISGCCAGAVLEAQASADSGADVVTGSGTVVFPDFGAGDEVFQFMLGATSNPQQRGIIQAKSSLGQWEIADVSCTRVVGRRAWVVGAARQPWDYLGVRVAYVVLYVEDNGQGGNAVPDMATGLALSTAAAESLSDLVACRGSVPPLEWLPTFPLVAGNVVVHDA
jgi:hypothetical protein